MLEQQFGSLFLGKYSILNECQHGFRQKRSTMSATHNFHNELTRLMNNGETPVGILCDLSRVLNSMDQKSYGIREIRNEWFSSCLTKRSQFVEINTVNTKSDKTE